MSAMLLSVAFSCGVPNIWGADQIDERLGTLLIGL